MEKRNWEFAVEEKYVLCHTKSAGILPCGYAFSTETI